MSKNQQQNNVFLSMPSQHEPGVKLSLDEKHNYQVELNASQANAINKLLPKGYILNIEKEVKLKRQSSKKVSLTKSQKLVMDEEQQTKLKKSSSSMKFNEDIPYSNYSRANSGYFQQVNQTLKPCLKILHLLKSCKASWPFREPVDPISSGVPNYFQVIKEPMDLQTIEENLKNNIYTTSLQFHADVNKIIQNSYLFNRNNSQFHKITQQFEHYYLKVSADPNRSIPSSSVNANERKKKTKVNKKEVKQRILNDDQPPTLAQKKTLALQLKKFPKEYLIRVGEIVYEGRHPESQELNIQNLPTKKIRELQRYVAEKNGELEGKNQIPKNIPYSHREQNSEEQSSFKSDSDS